MQDNQAHLITKILHRLSKFKDGASVQQILEALPKETAKRSLQRLLMNLVAEKKIIRVGAGRAIRYKLAELSSVEKKIPSKNEEGKTDLHIVLSTQGQALKQRVNLPLSKRKPVGYQHKFLTSYQPNKTRYLDHSTTRQLEEIAHLTEDNLEAGTYAKQLYQRVLIDLSWNSSRLEGNTYSLLETSRLIEIGESSAARNAIETQMILNHKAAIEFLITNHKDIGFNSFTILNVHALLSENLLSSAQAEGRLRSIAVGIGGSVFHPLEGPQLIQQYFELVLKKAAQIKNPFEQSFFLLVQLPYLQPFEDVNKRVSRLAANIPFIKKSLCPLSFVDVPDKDYIDGLLAIYELNDVSLLRDVFVWAYKRSASRYAAVRHSLGEPDPFKLRYRAEIKQTVATIIQEGLNRAEAILNVRKVAKSIPTEDRKLFIDNVETELLDVHEGNFAKFGVRPSEFKAWKQKFSRKA